MKKPYAALAGVVFGLAFNIPAQTAVVGSLNGDVMRVPSAQGDSIVSVVAEAEGLQLVSPDQVPPCGTFWTFLPGPGGGLMPPFPCPPLDPSLPIYAIADGQFLVAGAGGQAADGTSADVLAAQAEAVLNLIMQVQTAAANRQMRAMGMDVPFPGDGGGDGGTNNNYSSFASSYTIDTNGLWLAITNMANGWTYMNLHNATNQVYAIWSTTNLLTAFANWQVEMEVWPSPEQTSVLPLTIPTLGRQNLFLRAEDWTGVDSDGNGLPDAWEFANFGHLGVDPNADPDGDGWTNLQEYQNRTDPNVAGQPFLLIMAQPSTTTIFP